MFASATGDFIRGKETYSANLNPQSSTGTIASIESVLRSLDRRAEEEARDIEQKEKALADYKAQLGRPFEHEARLKELLGKQAQLNAALDLDKHDSQTIAEMPESGEKAAGFVGRVQVEGREAEAAMA